MKIFNKIKSVIYSQDEGRFSEEEAFKEIKKIMDIHNKLKW